MKNQKLKDWNWTTVEEIIVNGWFSKKADRKFVMEGLRKAFRAGQKNPDPQTQK